MEVWCVEIRAKFSASQVLLLNFLKLLCTKIDIRELSATIKVYLTCLRKHRVLRY